MKLATVINARKGQILRHAAAKDFNYERLGVANANCSLTCSLTCSRWLPCWPLEGGQHGPIRSRRAPRAGNNPRKVSVGDETARRERRLRPRPMAYNRTPGKAVRRSRVLYACITILLSIWLGK